MDDDLIRRAAEKMAGSVGSQAFRQPGLAWDGFRGGWLGYATAALSVVEPELAAQQERADTTEAAFVRARQLAADMLALLAVVGHPGRPAVRTHWIDDEIAQKWRAELKALWAVRAAALDDTREAERG